MIFTPLEQFEIIVLKSLTFFYDFSITNATLYLVLASGLSFFVLKSGIYRAKLIPSMWQSIVELIYKFIISMALQQAGRGVLPFFPLIFSAFVFILSSNLLGLMPFGFTTTSHIAISFGLSFSFNLGFLFLGLLKYQLHFFKLFVPEGAPKMLMPLIVVIEVVSYCLRPFSLAIRLFANMFAGHTLLFILSSFVLGLAKTSLFLLGLIPLVLVLAICALELGIACLQAYVFTILLCIYLNDSLNLH